MQLPYKFAKLPSDADDVIEYWLFTIGPSSVPETNLITKYTKDFKAVRRDHF